jgi:hypothetical protein
MKLPEISTYPKGELIKPQEKANYLSDCIENNERLSVETYGGRVHVEWDPSSSVTPLGQLAFFIEFLKMGDLLDRIPVSHWPQFIRGDCAFGIDGVMSAAEETGRSRFDSATLPRSCR